MIELHLTLREGAPLFLRAETFTVYATVVHTQTMKLGDRHDTYKFPASVNGFLVLETYERVLELIEEQIK
tara:strand:+ start:883 stop:1092 length:210 start_codon:yes stop_codon:yes gene_type:complete